MSSGYYLTAPFFYFNLGSHMMYILRNRLEAQQVRTEKALKILQDIALAIFKEQFISGLLIPQDPFNVPTLKGVFSKLAHSSVMKLDQSSMDKLFYLMVMSIKKETFLVSSPLELFTLTLSHLLNLVKCLEDTEATKNIKMAIEQFQSVASNYSYIQFSEIRDSILSELEGYQTKIVNFMEAGHQTTSGALLFKFRNSHNQKSLGSATNQNELQGLHQEKASTCLFYKDWMQWKTSLVVNFVQNYKISSQRRRKSTQTKKQSVKQTQTSHKQKGLADLLNVKSENVGQFQVKFDILGDNSASSSNIDYEVEESSRVIKNAKDPKNSSGNATNNKKGLQDKINNEFSDLNLNDNTQDDDQEDLLEMMDS